MDASSQKTQSPAIAQGVSCACQPSEDEMLRGLDVVMDGFAQTDGALIPILQAAQSLFGYLPKSVLKHISLRLKIPYSEVTGVVTFYSFFSTIPRGKHVIRVCLGTACYVRGGGQVLEALKKRLAINVGETTDDRMFTLEVARCFGACGLAPTMAVDDVVFKRVRPGKVAEIVDGFYSKGENVKEGARHA